MQVQRDRYCTPFGENAPVSLNDVMTSFNSHHWELKSLSDSKEMGMVIALKCSRCHLEWSSIISKSM